MEIDSFRDLPILTYKEAQDLDSFTQTEWKIPGQQLMAIAGKSLLEQYRSLWKKDRPIVIFTGKGNNGGDGYALGYFLLQEGYSVTIFEWTNNPKTDSSRFFRNLYIRSGGVSNNWENVSDFFMKIKSDCILVDCILGIGAKGELTSELWGIRDVLQNILSHKSYPFLAVDHMSFGETIRYSHLAELGYFKMENISFPLRQKKVISLGFPLNDFLKNYPSEKPTYFFSPPWVWEESFRKKEHFHKYKSGACAFIGGENGMEGAIHLSSLAFMGLGGGIAKIFYPSHSSPQAYINDDPSFMRDNFSDESPEDSFFQKTKTVVWGPGTMTGGKNKEIKKYLSPILSNREKKIVIDAGAIPAKADWESDYFGENILFTPHWGEFVRLLGRDSLPNIQTAIDESKIFAQEKKTNLFVKSHICFFTNHQGITWVWDYPEPRLATMGTGDLLTGIIAISLSRGYEFKESIHQAMSILKSIQYMNIESPTSLEILNFLKKMKHERQNHG